MDIRHHSWDAFNPLGLASGHFYNMMKPKTCLFEFKRSKMRSAKANAAIVSLYWTAEDTDIVSM